MRSDRAPGAGEPYPPIADYALLADCHSAALVSRDASVDWACLRRFDAESVFGRILDWERGGSFSVAAEDLQRAERRYVDDSLVLETTLTTGTGVARILDAFSMHRGGAKRPHNQLLRIVDVTEGAVDLTVRIVPRFHYGELRPWLERAVTVWEEPDRGIWEVRGRRRHFVHSKVWLWVAMDRGIRLVEERGHECRDLDRWRRARDAVHAAVETHGVDADGGHFVQHFGSSEVDAALLQLPMVGFVKADDERMVRTVDRIQRDIATEPHGFVHRYRAHLTDDGLPGAEGTS